MKATKKVAKLLAITLVLAVILGLSTTALAFPLLPVEPPTPVETLPADVPPEPNYITVVAYPAGSGTVSGGGYYTLGQRVQLNATANANYRFTGWYFSDYQQATNPNFFFYCYGENVTIVARFERLPDPAPVPTVPPVPPSPITPTAPGGTPPAPGTIGVIIGGNWVQYDVPPMTENGRTLVPLRATFEALGATVDWNEQTLTVTGVRGNTTVTLTIGQSYAYVNGARIALDVPGRTVGGRTMVPLRFISESLGGVVDWNAETQTITITQPVVPH